MNLAIIKYDETRYLEPADQHKVGTLWAYYLVDLDAAHHMCDLRPSVDLQGVYVDTANRVDDELYDCLSRETRETTQSVYLSDLKKMRIHSHAHNDHVESFEDALEDLQANPVFLLN